jgi:hypothetical protein
LTLVAAGTGSDSPAPLKNAAKRFLRRRRHAGFQEDSMPRRRAGLLLVIAAFVAVLFLFSVLSGFLTDWWWFKEIGYQVVFTRELVTRALLFLAAGGA